MSKWIFALVLLALWLGLSLASYFVWTDNNGKNFDLYPRWEGAREMLRGENPYEEIDLNPTETRTRPEYFLYPATITYILLPFWLLPWTVAVALWLGFQLVLLVSLPALVFYLLRWRLNPILLASIVFISAFAFRHTINIYLLGQFVVFTLACLIIAWWQTHGQRPWLAALALLGATVRPEGIILVSAFLFDLVLKRHYKTVLIWGTAMGSLFLLSVLQIGFWIPDMLENIPNYRECCTHTDPPDVLGYSVWVGYLIRVGVAAWAGWMLWMLRPLPDLTRIPWSLSVVLIAYLLIFTQTKNYTLAYALLPIWVLLRFTGSWQRGLVMLFFFLPWLYLILDQPDGTATPYEQLLTPLMLGAFLTYVWYQQKGALLGELGDWQESSASS